ncbi:hypothetical protein MPH47_12330 [Psychrobacillus psychrodurans]|uniref:hypothetical protein n=1 Tax=Psychrobacillus TaxID=1221880 RepID=UPI0008EC11F5|nr:hypothetical protein [Psychrobacillus psychrodurans]MCK1998001.1 hypothetical protein [Psychrobacillus psychrodurans]MCZ8540170.1 hypothetical protein [Psychrobacillus psychrodurans]SFM48672.1 hypothetical protein SAMN05421832_10343 [Psychrobacillus psychrodurans]
MPIILIYKELNHLIDDYYKCPFTHIKEQILIDINLLTDALLMFDADIQLEAPLKSV